MGQLQGVDTGKHIGPHGSTPRGTSQRAEIVEEHETLRELLDRVRLVILAPTNALPERRFRKLIAHQIHVLTGFVEAHFETEERGGYMVEVLNARPGWASRVAALEKEHGRIRTTLAELRSDVRADGPITALIGQLATLTTLIQRHERAESELIQASFVEDLGGSG